ncbi:MAG: DUF460 domain-containing protein [Candidatus Nanohaloarchaea archaeon]|nr:DUF460 domain-containing protein [Candidatus Nanohaloarchaea archaeon]
MSEIAEMETELRVVGIDPGTTTGVAALRLDGTLIDYTSRRGFAKDRVIQFMVEAGKPLIVAADVAPAPDLVEEIGSNTGSVVAAPDTDLSQERKEQLTEPFQIGGEDSHVLDAVAAAEYARRTYADTINEICRRTAEEGVEPDRDEIIDLVVNRSFSVSNAITEVAGTGDGQEEAGDTADDGGETDWEAVAAARQERIELLESKVANLQEYVDELESDEEPQTVSEEELRRRNRRIRDLAGDLEQAKADIERLEAEQEAWKQAVTRLAEGWLHVPKVDSLADADTGAAAVSRYSGGRIAADVETVVAEQVTEELESAPVTAVPLDEADRVVETPEAYVVHPEELEAVEQDAEAFMEWLDAYRAR